MVVELVALGAGTADLLWLAMTVALGVLVLTGLVQVVAIDGRVARAIEPEVGESVEAVSEEVTESVEAQVGEDVAAAVGEEVDEEVGETVEAEVGEAVRAGIEGGAGAAAAGGEGGVAGIGEAEPDQLTAADLFDPTTGRVVMLWILTPTISAVASYLVFQFAPWF